MSTRLPKDHFVMERPYSGRAIFYATLRESGVVNVKDYFKRLAKEGRKVTAINRIIYRVGKYVEEFGYDLFVDYDTEGNPKTVKLIKSEDGPKKPSKPSKKAKPSKPAKKEKKTSKPSKKAAKPAKKTKKEDSESESSAESESASDESSETVSDETES